MPTDLTTRKPVQLLGPADFEAFSLWEYADDEESAKGRDETWVRPVDSVTVPQSYYAHAAADITTANGHQFSGCVTISTLLPIPEVCQGWIFYRGKSLFVCNPEAFGFRKSRDDLLAVIELGEKQVFPLKFRMRMLIAGMSEPFYGILP